MHRTDGVDGNCERLSQIFKQLLSTGVKLLCAIIIAARKRSLGQGNVFRSVCLSRGDRDPSQQRPLYGKERRYASYWNAFLLCTMSSSVVCTLGFVYTSSGFMFKLPDSTRSCKCSLNLYVTLLSFAEIVY